jgi:hypothetical protein
MNVPQFLLLLQICGSYDCHFEPTNLAYPSMIACLEAGFTLMEDSPEQIPKWQCEERTRKWPLRWNRDPAR